MNTVAILQHSCPFPFTVEGNFYDGTIHQQLNICRKCEKKSCLQLVGIPFRHLMCAKGFSCYPIAIDGTPFVLNGLIASEHNTEILGKQRKPYRDNILSHTAILEFQDHMQHLQAAITDVVSKEIKGSLAYLHDIRTSVGIVLSWCQEVVGAGSGSTFEDKLKRASDEVLGLYQSINLLKEQLNLADIIPNPAAIKYGHMGQSSINGFLYKMLKIFEPRFRSKGLDIQIEGYTKAKIEAYNSIQFIPLLLLDNALKYSAPSRTTYIRLRELRAAKLIEVTVSSYGRVVPQDSWGKIFDKYFRGANALELNPQGMGLGLYIAQAIAEAHSFRIHYKSTSSDGLTGSNDFAFQMPVCGYEA